jgi:hypothetical protein
MTEVRLACISRLVAPVAQIALGHHPKRTDGRQRPAVVAVQFVPVIANHHDLAFEPTGQFEAFEEDIARIAIAFASVSITVTRVATAAGIVRFAVTSELITERCPRHLNVADVFIAVAGIEIEHGDSLVERGHDRVQGDDESDYAKPCNRQQFAIGWRRAVSGGACPWRTAITHPLSD